MAAITQTFVGGPSGEWKIVAINATVGEGLELAPFIDIRTDPTRTMPHEVAWSLRGVASNVRYSTREELQATEAAQPALGRAEATCAALVAIRKSDRWWNLAQDERRAIFDWSSQHIRIGQEYLPAIARKLLHSRDLGEPFDFLTWFEFAPQHAGDFAQLLQRLRATPEWSFVDREVTVLLQR